MAKQFVKKKVRGPKGESPRSVVASFHCFLSRVVFFLGGGGKFIFLFLPKTRTLSLVSHARDHLLKVDWSLFPTPPPGLRGTPVGAATPGGFQFPTNWKRAIKEHRQQKQQKQQQQQNRDIKTAPYFNSKKNGKTVTTLGADAALKVRWR